GRRANPLQPDASLILQKPLGQVSHEGGQRFSANSREARIITEWIGQGTRDDPASQAGLRIEATPGVRVLDAATPWQQLAIRATFADGVRDVTRLTVYKSSDDSIATVRTTGLVEFWQPGE